MLLNNFKTGWKEAFTPKLEILFKMFPDITFVNAKRQHGLLKISISALDKDTQYVVDCVIYKIERESAKTCEECGRIGQGRIDLLPEKMCLCWKCYALEVDAIERSNT